MSYNKDNDFFMMQFNASIEKHQMEKERKKMERNHRAIMIAGFAFLATIIFFKVLEMM